MPSQTTFGVPYPTADEPVAEGARRIQDVAEALDARVLAGEIAWGAAGAAVDTWLRRIEPGAIGTPGSFYVSGPYFSLTAATIFFGAAWDTNLYRQGAGVLRTDGTFVAGANIAASSGAAWEVQIGYVAGVAGVLFGNDTSLYRAGAGALKTDGKLIGDAGVQVGGAGLVSANDTALLVYVQGLGDRRVVAGAPDSGGTGTRVLRVLN